MTTYLERQGHLRLADGTILRLDAECGQFVASMYTPGPDHLVLRAYGYGTFEAMKEMSALWVDAFEASLTSPVGGETAGSGAAIPAPGQPNLLGEAI